jgi:ankyrin repeat protein
VVFTEEFANAVMAGDYKLVKRALLGESKYDLECPDMDGKTLLMWAVHHGMYHCFIIVYTSTAAMSL